MAAPLQTDLPQANSSEVVLAALPPDIKLEHSLFNKFDREELLRCVDAFLDEPRSGKLVSGLIDAATIKTSSQDWFRDANERWILLDQVPRYVPPEGRVAILDDELETSAWIKPSPNDSAQIELLDLHKLYNLLPSGQAEFDLAALDSNWQIVLEYVYSITAITSILLNAITVIVLFRSQRSELRKYLINLSLSDLLISCLSIPFTYTEYMRGFFNFPLFLCPIVRFVVTLSVFVSVATMTVIGINRHSAIMYPLKRKKPPKIRHWRLKNLHVILGIWLLGIAVSSPDYLMNRADPFCFNQQLYFTCRQVWPKTIANFYTIFIYISTFIAPLLLLSFLYVRMSIKLMHRRPPGNENINRDATMQMQRSKVIKMLLVVVLAFLIFWLPIQTFAIVDILLQHYDTNHEYESVANATYFLCHWLSMAHSCINPLIYGFMSKKFRSSLKELVCSVFSRNRKKQWLVAHLMETRGPGFRSCHSPNFGATSGSTPINESPMPALAQDCPANHKRNHENGLVDGGSQTRQHRQPIKSAANDSRPSKSGPVEREPGGTIDQPQPQFSKCYLADDEHDDDDDDDDVDDDEGEERPAGKSCRRACNNNNNNNHNNNNKNSNRPASGAESLVMVEFHGGRRDKCTSQLKCKTAGLARPREGRDTPGPVWAAEARWAPAMPRGRMSCGQAIVQTLQELAEERDQSDESSEDEPNNEYQEEDGHSCRGQQDIEGRLVAIKQSGREFRLYRQESGAAQHPDDYAGINSASSASPAAEL